VVLEASGGFLSNILFEETVNFGSQQQWLSRNSNFSGGSQYGAWSLVFQNSLGQQAASVDTTARPVVTATNATPFAEKPYISKVAPGSDKFVLHIPKVQFDSSLFASFSNDASMEAQVDFSNVFVATSKTDVSAIQAAIDSNNHVVFCPGIYNLTMTLHVKFSGQVLLGLGMATLVAPQDQTLPAIYIPPELEDVRIAGFMLEASVPNDLSVLPFPGSTLIKWGDEKAPKRKRSSPTAISGVLSDIFARVGGSNLDRNTSVETMIVIHSDNVIGDNLWLWRADHSKLRPGEVPNKPGKYHSVVWDECKCDTALKVTGDHVSMYGLATEHTQKDLVHWSGNHGKTIFFQSELPYDASQDFGDKYVAYRIVNEKNDPSFTHNGYGMGVYSFFRDHTVHARKGIAVIGSTDGIVLENLFTRWLDQSPDSVGSTIEHIVNNQGDKVEIGGCDNQNYNYESFKLKFLSHYSAKSS